jgi:carbonic anhydrase
MSKKLGYLGWRLLSLMVLFALLLSACDLSAAPRPTPIPQEAPIAQEAQPSEADLYATAIASLGGSLTETAIVEESMRPLIEETPIAQVELPTAEGTMPIPAEGQLPAGGQPGMPVPTGQIPGGTAMPMMGVTPTPGGYDSNYNPNLDRNYNPNNPYGSMNPSYQYPNNYPQGSYYYPNNPYYNNYPQGYMPQGGGSVTYVVQPGDWLYSIARRYGVTPDAIIAANPGIGTGNLYPGQVLVIPNPAYQNPQQQLQWYPRYVATSVWYPEYYWSYGNNPTMYPDWYMRFGTPVPGSAWMPDSYWKYGPENWGTIPQYAQCATSRNQSPVNIDASKVSTGSTQGPKFHYRVSDVNLVSNDFTFQVEVPSGSYIELEGATYELMNITFHMPSEHTVNGKPYYMEIQLIHFNANTQKWAVVSVFVNEGTQDNGLLSPIWFSLPQPPYDTRQIKSFDLNVFIPPDTKAYAYTGSITTPPCTEGVNWIIMAAPIELSRSQIERYRSLYPYNARPVQDLSDRPVYAVQ